MFVDEIEIAFEHRETVAFFQRKQIDEFRWKSRRFSFTVGFLHRRPNNFSCKSLWIGAKDRPTRRISTIERGRAKRRWTKRWSAFWVELFLFGFSNEIPFSFLYSTKFRDKATRFCKFIVFYRFSVTMTSNPRCVDWRTTQNERINNFSIRLFISKFRQSRKRKLNSSFDGRIRRQTEEDFVGRQLKRLFLFLFDVRFERNFGDFLSEKKSFIEVRRRNKNKVEHDVESPVPEQVDQLIVHGGQDEKTLNEKTKLPWRFVDVKTNFEFGPNSTQQNVSNEEEIEFHRAKHRHDVDFDLGHFGEPDPGEMFRWERKTLLSVRFSPNPIARRRHQVRLSTEQNETILSIDRRMKNFLTLRNPWNRSTSTSTPNSRPDRRSTSFFTRGNLTNFWKIVLFAKFVNDSPNFLVKLLQRESLMKSSVELCSRRNISGNCGSSARIFCRSAKLFESIKSEENFCLNKGSSLFGSKSISFSRKILLRIEILNEKRKDSCRIDLNVVSSDLTFPWEKMKKENQSPWVFHCIGSTLRTRGNSRPRSIDVTRNSSKIESWTKRISIRTTRKRSTDRNFAEFLLDFVFNESFKRRNVNVLGEETSSQQVDVQRRFVEQIRRSQNFLERNFLRFTSAFWVRIDFVFLQRRKTFVRRSSSVDQKNLFVELDSTPLKRIAQRLKLELVRSTSFASLVEQRIRSFDFLFSFSQSQRKSSNNENDVRRDHRNHRERQTCEMNLLSARNCRTRSRSLEKCSRRTRRRSTSSYRLVFWLIVCRESADCRWRSGIRSSNTSREWVSLRERESFELLHKKKIKWPNSFSA